MATVADLIQEFREDQKDSVAPYFWSDNQLIRWINEGLAQFAINTHAILDYMDISLLPRERFVDVDPSVLAVIEARSNCNGYYEDYYCGYRRPYGCYRHVCYDKLGRIEVYPIPAIAGTLNLKVIRKPLRKLTQKAEQIPDLMDEWLPLIYLFMQYRAYNVADAETFDKTKSNNRYAEFLDGCQRVREECILRTGSCNRPIRSNW